MQRSTQITHALRCPPFAPISIVIQGCANSNDPKDQYETDARALYETLKQSLPSGTYDALRRILCFDVAMSEQETQATRLAATVLHERFTPASE